MFTKDSRTENFLTQMGVSFAYTNNVHFSDIEHGWESVNVARPVPIREDAVEEYAALMNSGSVAPAPILLKATKLKILDGVQRMAAAQLYGTSNISAYVVECDSENMIAVIRVLSNARLQGRAEPAEWTRRKAVEVLILERGMSVAEVAKMGGWRPSEIESTAKCLEWSTKVIELGGPELPDAMISVISDHATQIDLAPKPAAEFLHTIKNAKLSTADAEPFIAEFFKPVTKTGKAHETFTHRLNEFTSDPEIVARVKGRKSPGLSHAVNLRRTLRTASTVLDDIIQHGESLPYVDEFFKITKEINEKLHALAPKHNKSEIARVPADMWSQK